MISSIKGVLCTVGAVVFLLSNGRHLNAEPFSFVALGDTAYITPDDYPTYEQLIRNINHYHPQFTIHVGDLWGSGPCSNDNMHRQKEYFNRFEQALIYTPGDNEWVDCHRKLWGGYSPLERLAFIRKTFFSTPQSLGKVPIALQRQSENPDYKTYVENARWQHDDVLFATVHVTGSSNNAAHAKESHARNLANIAWIDALFEDTKSAKKNAVKAIIIALHADMFNERGKVLPHYKETANHIIAGAKASALPVLLIHGDSHQYIVDTPFKKASNITRLQVHGFPVIKAVKIGVNTASSSTFSFSFSFSFSTINAIAKPKPPAKE